MHLNGGFDLVQLTELSQLSKENGWGLSDPIWNSKAISGLKMKPNVRIYIQKQKNQFSRTAVGRML